MIKTLKKATLRNDVATFEHYYTAEEINVFMIVVNKIQTNQISEFSGLNGLRFKIKEIRENIGYSANFEKILDEINKKKITGFLKWDLIDDRQNTLLKKGARYSIVPFVSFGEDDENYVIKIHPEFYPMVKNLSKNYTSIELESFLSLGSLGLKNLYKFLLAHKHIGKIEIGIDELKKLVETEIVDNATFIKKFKTQTVKSILEKTNICEISVSTDGKGKRKATKVLICFKLETQTLELSPEQILILNNYLKNLCKKNMEFSKGVEDKDFTATWNIFFKKYNSLAIKKNMEFIQLIIQGMEKLQNFKFDSTVKNPVLALEKQIQYILDHVDLEIINSYSYSTKEKKVSAMNKKAEEALEAVHTAKIEAMTVKEKVKITYTKYKELYKAAIEKTGRTENSLPDFSKRIIKQSLDNQYEIIDEDNKWDENKDFGWENFRVEGYPTEEFFIQSMYRYFLEQSGIEDNFENRKYFEDIKRDIQNDFIVTIKKEWLESIKAQGIFWEEHPNLTINLIKANVARTMHLKKNK